MKMLNNELQEAKTRLIKNLCKILIKTLENWQLSNLRNYSKLSYLFWCLNADVSDNVVKIIINWDIRRGSWRSNFVYISFKNIYVNEITVFINATKISEVKMAIALRRALSISISAVAIHIYLPHRHIFRLRELRLKLCEQVSRSLNDWTNKFSTLKCTANLFRKQKFKIERNKNNERTFWWSRRAILSGGNCKYLQLYVCICI